MTEYYFTLPANPDLDALNLLVITCENEVYFESTEGDRIALKSTLGQYLFFTIIRNADLLANSYIHCTGEHDKTLLKTQLILKE